MTKHFQAKLASPALAMADGGHINMDTIRREGLRGPGSVRGPGGPRDDKVPAMLSNGEYILPADVVSKLGVDNINALVAEHHEMSNDHDGDERGVRHFANGGPNWIDNMRTKAANFLAPGQTPAPAAPVIAASSSGPAGVTPTPSATPAAEPASALRSAETMEQAAARRANYTLGSGGKPPAPPIISADPLPGGASGGGPAKPPGLLSRIGSNGLRAAGTLGGGYTALSGANDMYNNGANFDNVTDVAGGTALAAPLIGAAALPIAGVAGAGLAGKAVGSAIYGGMGDDAREKVGGTINKALGYFGGGMPDAEAAIDQGNAAAKFINPNAPGLRAPVATPAAEPVPAPAPTLAAPAALPGEAPSAGVRKPYVSPVTVGKVGPGKRYLDLETNEWKDVPADQMLISGQGTPGDGAPGSGDRSRADVDAARFGLRGGGRPNPADGTWSSFFGDKQAQRREKFDINNATALRGQDLTAYGHELSANTARAQQMYQMMKDKRDYDTAQGNRAEDKNREDLKELPNRIAAMLPPTKNEKGESVPDLAAANVHTRALQSLYNARGDKLRAQIALHPGDKAAAAALAQHEQKGVSAFATEQLYKTVKSRQAQDIAEANHSVIPFVGGSTDKSDTGPVTLRRNPRMFLPNELHMIDPKGNKIGSVYERHLRGGGVFGLGQKDISFDSMIEQPAKKQGGK